MPGPGRKFVKGKSPNPGGRPRVAPDVKEALRKLTPRSVERLAELMESRDDKVAIVAVREVLDRNLGKHGWRECRAYTGRAEQARAPDKRRDYIDKRGVRRQARELIAKAGGIARSARLTPIGAREEVSK